MTTYMAIKKKVEVALPMHYYAHLSEKVSLVLPWLSNSILHLVKSNNISRLSNTIPFVSVVAMVLQNGLKIMTGQLLLSISAV